MQSSGKIIDAREILTLKPADLRGIGQSVDIDLETQRTGLFGQKDFDTVFRADVGQAKTSILIFSGFVTPERVGAYGDLFRRKILEGLKIRCVTRPPSRNGSVPVQDGKAALDFLENIGVIIDCRRDIHQKLCYHRRPYRVVWITQPAFSYGEDRRDHDAGACPTICVRARPTSRASETGRDDANGGIPAENPRCGRCEGRSYYLFSRRLGRSFFTCEDECGWLQDADNAMSSRKWRAGSGDAQRQRSH
jgi:hypothetical protein